MAVPDLKVKKISLKEDKIYLEDGREVALDSELKEMIQNPEQNKRVRSAIEAERQAQSQVEKLPLGGEFHAFSKSVGRSALGNLITNYVTQPLAAAKEAFTVQPGQEEKGYLGRIGENLQTFKEAKKYYEPELSEKYPMSSKIGSLFGFGTDILAASKVPGGAMAEGAALGFSGAPAIYDDPGEALKETAIGGAIGYGVGKVGEKLQKVASDRAASRAYKAAQEAYPAESRAARESFRATQREKLNAASQDLRRGVHKSSLNNDAFINEAINLSEMAGSSEANSVVRFIRTLESGVPENISSREVTKIFDALEGKIAKASEAEIPLLQSYKQHLVEQIPIGAANNAVKDQVGNLLIQRVEGKGAQLAKDLGSNSTQFSKNLREKISSLVGDMNPQEFVNSLENGEIADLIRQETKNAYMEIFTSGKANKQFKNTSFLKNLDQKSEQLAEDMIQGLYGDIQSLQSQANDLNSYVQKRVSSRVRNATGSPNPTMDIPPTNQLRLPPEPIDPNIGRMARAFEETPYQPLQQVKEAGKESLGVGLLGNLLGLPGKAIGGMRALYGAGKAGIEGSARFLTAPTRVSGMTRESIRRGGLPLLVESIANTYPSYDKGILLDPMDRIDAVAEIENNPYIPLEQKAILQAKINRGRNIEELKEFQEEVR